MFGKSARLHGLDDRFSTKALVLIPIAVGINIIGGTLCSMLKLPLFLDTVGTLIVACLSTPFSAAITGLLTNIFLAFVANPVFLPYAVVSMLCGLVVGFLVRVGMFRNVYGAIFVWIACTLVNSISAALITTFVFGGATGVNGTSLITAAFVVAMRDILLSVFSSSFLENLIDKGITVFIAYAVFKKLPRRLLTSYGPSLDSELLEDEVDREL
ncbi:ECF transporter S component [Collinsella sp. AGMB00827]|uniref:ECF transporter S component n=1 Tax=Collinsella ureilytica TaxID=2869515 RepID=A0ABS7MIE3_9ACTN|nr:ECF transporter S component [Collinsella urealyticum]MBY4797057.1 ECF transporter S component [Collinsella urealyticum]